MNDPEVVVGMRVVRIGPKRFGNAWLFGDVFTVVTSEPSWGEVILHNPNTGSLRSRFNDFWSRWEIYQEPNDLLKGLI